MKAKQLVSNMTMQTASFALSMLINFFLTPVIIGKIGTEVYGFFGLANNFLEYASIITATINVMANRFITIAYTKGEITDAKKYFTSVTVANIIITVVLSVPAVIIVAFLEKFMNVPMEHLIDIKILWSFVFAMFFTTLIFSRYDVATFAKNRLDITAMINMVSVFTRAVLLFIAYKLLPPYISYLGIIVFLCAVLTSSAHVHFKKKLAPDLTFDRHLYRFSAVLELVKVGVWNSISQLSQILFTGLDLLIANIFIGAKSMSLLSVAKTLPIMIIGLISVIAGVFAPTMTISYSKGNVDDFCHETAFAAKLCGFLCSIPIIGVVVFGKVFFRLWLPSLPVSDIIQVQTLSVLTLLPQLFSTYIFPLHQINTITCKVKVPALVDCLVGVLNIAVVYILLRFTELGLYAIAGVSSVFLIIRIITFVPMYAAHNINVSRKTFYPYLGLGMLVNITVGTVFYIINKLTNINSWITFACVAAFAAVIGYLIGFLIMFSKREKQAIMQKLVNKLKGTS